MKGGVRKRGNTWYYYFDLGIVDGKRKKFHYTENSESTETQFHYSIWKIKLRFRF